eukprot:NODE_166_length_14584_cov_1.124750.p1 type:complete len:552 gc:universal NODE_166_length_14584_cov_1.124750:5744-4089(-)
MEDLKENSMFEVIKTLENNIEINDTLEENLYHEISCISESTSVRSIPNPKLAQSLDSKLNAISESQAIVSKIQEKEEITGKLDSCADFAFDLLDGQNQQDKPNEMFDNYKNTYDANFHTGTEKNYSDNPLAKFKKEDYFHAKRKSNVISEIDKKTDIANEFFPNKVRLGTKNTNIVIPILQIPIEESKTEKKFVDVMDVDNFSEEENENFSKEIVSEAKDLLSEPVEIHKSSDFGEFHQGVDKNYLEETEDEMVPKIRKNEFSILNQCVVKKLRKTVVVEIPTKKAKLNYIVDRLGDIDLNLNTFTCYGCEESVTISQQVLFPHIRNCSMINCFSKWMFNFDALKYGISYAVKESDIGRWNNTKLLLKTLDFDGIEEELEHYYSFEDDFFVCNACSHIVRPDFVVDGELAIFQTMVVHLFSCNDYDDVDKYLISKGFLDVSKSAKKPFKRSNVLVKKDLCPVFVEPVFSDPVVAEHYEQKKQIRLKELNLQIENKKIEFEILKTESELEKEKLLLEIEATKLQLRLKAAEYLKNHPNKEYQDVLELLLLDF